MKAFEPTTVLLSADPIGTVQHKGGKVPVYRGASLWLARRLANDRRYAEKLASSKWQAGRLARRAA